MKERPFSGKSIKKARHDEKKRGDRLTLTLLLIAAGLLLSVALTVVINPLFHYHLPLFGMQPVITNERYQNAGVAARFRFDTAVIGSSMAENLTVSDMEKAFGGPAVKLTASGSHTADWVYLLKIIEEREDRPERIVMNLDPMILSAQPDELKHELPLYLYDNVLINDVSYWFNWEILKDFCADTVYRNLTGTVPDYDAAFTYPAEGSGFVLSHYERPEPGTVPETLVSMRETAFADLDALIPYIERMPETEFIFYYSPVSMLYWDEMLRTGTFGSWRVLYRECAEKLLACGNAAVYLWTDEEMFSVSEDLDNYRDTAHFSIDVGHLITRRIGSGEGRLTRENCAEETGKYFDHYEVYPFEAFFAASVRE